VADSGYHLVLEDGSDISDSSNDANRLDELTDMYALGCAIESARLTEAQAHLLRSQGKAGGQGPVSRLIQVM
jgi:hypothetical protein